MQGDYWFYNVLIAGDGRRVVVNWQDPMIRSGLWELEYFTNLLCVVGPGEYRELPVREQTIVSHYRDSLASFP